MLVYRAPGYMLRVAPGDLDIRQFESLVTDGRSALADRGAGARRAALLGEALGLWRGPLLADVLPTPLLETQADVRPSCGSPRPSCASRRTSRAAGRRRSIPELHGLVTEHPLRERFWALLMRALEARGRRAEALETYAQARQVIADELGVDPGSELQRLYAELLRRHDASSPSSAPPKASAPSQAQDTVPATSADAPARGRPWRAVPARRWSGCGSRSHGGADTAGRRVRSRPGASRSALSPGPLRQRPIPGRTCRRRCARPAAGLPRPGAASRRHRRLHRP